LSVSESVSVVLPLPSGHLSPNSPPASFGGRMRKAKLTAALRNRTRLAVLESGITSGPWGLAKVTATFYHRDARRRDPDNYMAMLKGVYDGMRDAGLLVDDDAKHLIRGEPTFAVDRRAPRVELIVMRLDSGRASATRRRA